MDSQLLLESGCHPVRLDAVLLIHLGAEMQSLFCILSLTVACERRRLPPFPNSACRRHGPRRLLQSSMGCTVVFDHLLCWEESEEIDDAQFVIGNAFRFGVVCRIVSVSWPSQPAVVCHTLTSLHPQQISPGL